MKNKLLAIAIASALSTLWSSNLLAEGNSMDITQENSFGNVSATQENSTSGSGITIIQKDSDADSDITITQDGASSSNTTVHQYQGTGADDGSGTITGSTITITQSGGAADAQNTVNIQQGIDTEAASNISNTLEVNTQAGSGNSIVGYAAHDGTASSDAVMESFSTQSGAGNMATISQNGTSNTIGFTQSGMNNTASLTQDLDSTNSTMNVSQNDGDNNNVTASQTGTDGSDMNIIISQSADSATPNSDNQVTTHQNASFSNMMVTIDGSDNIAQLTQDFAATAGSDMYLTQTGNSNSADMSQYGDGNTMLLAQSSDSNIALLKQYGTADSMTVSQNGNATVTLTQGDAPTP